eukprot:9974-Heterocapsa_arctica.AAC.1
MQRETDGFPAVISAAPWGKQRGSPRRLPRCILPCCDIMTDFTQACGSGSGGHRGIQRLEIQYFCSLRRFRRVAFAVPIARSSESLQFAASTCPCAPAPPAVYLCWHSMQEFTYL